MGLKKKILSLEKMLFPSKSDYIEGDIDSLGLNELMDYFKKLDLDTSSDFKLNGITYQVFGNYIKEVQYPEHEKIPREIYYTVLQKMFESLIN